jgi:predicted HAD superfamily Cof-like phosphohydrolase
MKSDDVAAFHRMAANYSSLSSFREIPGVPDMSQAAHIMALLTEEFTELTDALMVENDVANTAREFIDLIYVSLQGLLSLGLRPDEIETMWRAVHESNMSKVDPERGKLALNGGRPYVDDAGKITKPPEFVPPDLAQLFERFRSSRPTPEFVY